jgi:hypothetical protein
MPALYFFRLRLTLVRSWDKCAGKLLSVKLIVLRIAPYFYQARKIAIARINLREQAEAAKEVIMAGADADTVEDAVIATLINRAMEVVTQDKITPSLYREVVGLVVRLREQKISMERLRLERARFELDVAVLVMKHIDKLKSSGVLQIEDRGEAAKKIRELMFGKYTKEQLEAAALAT